jgi:RNA polymerase sigma factor (sigma-70 family)
MAQPPEEFAALLARARQGDRDALGELVRQYEPELRVAVRVHLGPALRPYLDSMDVVQSVHHSLMRGIKQNKFDFATIKELLALAGTLVRRKIARHWGRMRRQQRGDGSCDVEQLLFDLTSTEEDPALAAQHRDQISHVCRHLDATDRRLIELKLLLFSTAQAARIMGVREDSLRVRLQRLRQKLREHGISPDCL